MNMLRRLLHKFVHRIGEPDDCPKRADADGDPVSDPYFGTSSGAAEAVDLTVSVDEATVVSCSCTASSLVSPRSSELPSRSLLDAQDPLYSINTSVLDVLFTGESAEDCANGRAGTECFGRALLADTTDSSEELFVRVAVMLDPAVVTEFQEIFIGRA